MNEPVRNRRLKKPERRQNILLELKLKPHVRVADLAARFGVTTETIRRDVEDLSREGHLLRDFGGASAPHPGSHRDLDERRRQRVAERELLGRHAASLVGDGDKIMIDAGSTTMELARFLGASGKRVTAITNSLQVAMTLGQNPQATVLMTPGRYVPREAAVIGSETCDFLARHHTDACFLGAAGLSDVGVTESVDGFAAVKRAMLQQSRTSYFMVDASKFGQTHLTQVAGFAEIGTLISDQAPAAEIADLLSAAGATLLVPIAG